MKILIISQNAWPLQGPRAFRTSELSEQFAKMGHDVVVYSVHGSCQYCEYMEVTKVKMKNIETFFPIQANDRSQHSNIVHRLLFHYLHEPLLYPEIELMYRVNTIIQKEKCADLLITIAFPHTIHFGAARAKKKHPKAFPKFWIADCGDPFYLNPMQKAPKFVEKLEKKWCDLCDFISVPTEGSKNGYFPEFRDKIRVIPQGFDFSKTPIEEYKKNEVPTFVFTGVLYPGKRDIHSFLDYLLEWKFPYKFKLYLHSPLEERYEIDSNHQIEFIIGKGRPEIIMECSKADFLINIKNPSMVQTPSKIIDYGIAKRPVLEISNKFCEYSIFEQFYNGCYDGQLKIDNLDSYRIEKVANQFLSLINC